MCGVAGLIWLDTNRGNENLACVFSCASGGEALFDRHESYGIVRLDSCTESANSGTAIAIQARRNIHRQNGTMTGIYTIYQLLIFIA